MAWQRRFSHHRPGSGPRHNRNHLRLRSAPPLRSPRPGFVPCSPTSPPPSILIIDDDDFGRDALGQILEADGYRVLRAANGQAALDYLNSSYRPRLIVLDLLMPGLDGWEFVQRYQASATHRAIPIIVVSASEVGPTIQQADSVVAIFQKPVPVMDLLQTIRCQVPL